MKITKLSSYALTAFVAASILAPASALAAPTTLGSTGTVTVEEGAVGGPDTETVDPENPDVTLPNPDPDGPDENINPDTGSLVIEKTTDLEFGTIETSANAIDGVFAAPMSFNGGADTRGAYVQWGDVRAGGTFGYTVTAQLTQQFTGTSTNKLTGATIDFKNGFMVAQGSNTNVAPSTAAGSFQLTETAGDKKVVVTADKANEEGKGRYIMAFGDSRASTEAESVELKLPAATASNMAADTYTATVTWTIEAAQ